MSTLQVMANDGEFGMPEIVENNDNLIENKAGVLYFFMFVYLGIP